MEKIDYPLLYYPLRENAILGILIGPDWESVQPDLPTMKSVFKETLLKEYRKVHYPYPQDIIHPTLKIFEISTQPIFKNKTTNYPLSQNVIVSVPVIHGELKEGGFECFIPLLNSHISYLEASQFKPIITSHVQNYLIQSTPERLFELMRYPTPQMDIISIRVKEKELSFGGWKYARKLVTLERFAVQVNKKSNSNLAVSLPEAAWERENEVAELIDKLLLANANVLVVGAQGAGKSAVIQQAIKQITLKSKGQPIGLSFWQITPQRITAGSKYLGDWEENVESMIRELAIVNGILWVDQIIQLLMQGGEAAEDSIASFLIPFLQSNKIRLLGEVTPQELESMRRSLPGFVEYFQLITLETLPEKKNQFIFAKFADFSQKKLGVSVESTALTQTYRLLQRYYPYEAFPGKAIRFLSASIHNIRQEKRTTLRSTDIVEQFIKQSGLPPIFLRDDIKLYPNQVKEYFTQRIIGQSNVVEVLTDIIKVYKAGLNDPSKPIATLLFAGPTGVGKTASAKALAQYFFGQGQKRLPLIRIDMSEFQHAHQFLRFIGIGKEVGQLVKEVREHPFAVLLLDEIEKAHPAIFDSLLTVLDEGFLLDHFGRLTNFRNTIIIMTTNLGASNRSALGFKDTTSEAARYDAAIRQFFRPEFVNRIDHVVQFNSLNQQDVERILLKELEELKQREGYEKRNLQLSFSSNLIQHIAMVGFDPKYGARPLQRSIEHNITNPMAKWMLIHGETENKSLWLDWDNGLSVSIL